MKIPDYKPVTRAHVPAAPPWIDDYMRAVHAQIISLTDAARYRDEEEIELTAEHGRTYDVEIRSLQGLPRGGRLIYSSAPVERMDLAIGNGRVQLTFWLVSGSGSTFVRCRIEGS